MLKTITSIAVYGAYITVAVFLAFVLWQSLFISDDSEGRSNKDRATHAEQQHADKQIAGTALPPKAHNPTEQLIADYTRWLAVFTALLVLATVALFVSGERNVEVATKAANAARDGAEAAKQAAEIAQKTLIASQRAWIRIDEIGLGGGALAFDKNGASISISFKITNVGNSPAINITPHVWLIALKNGGPFSLQEQQRLCNDIRNKPFQIGFTLFPNEQFPTNMGIGGWSLGTNISPDEVKLGLEVSADKKHVALEVFGCIDYTFPADPTTHHQTGFIRMLQKRGPTLVSPEDGMIPVGQLMLMPVAVGIGQYAD